MSFPPSSRSHAGYYRFSNPSPSASSPASEPKTPRSRPAPLALSHAPSSPTPSYSSTMSTASKAEIKAKLEPILFSSPSWKRVLGFAPKQPKKMEREEETRLSEEEVVVVKEMWDECMERF